MARSRWITGVAAIATVAALVAMAGVAEAKDKTVWLCKPGLAANPCDVNLDVTKLSPTGDILGTEKVKRERNPKVDCFYVYPTVSDDQTPNSDLSIDPEERSIALYQAARYSQYCRVYAPMYRQLTLTAIFGTPTEEQRLIAYNSALAAFKSYLKNYNDGRGIVFIGHSQGSFVLRQLITDEVDGKPSLRKRMVSALLLGGDVVVDEGKAIGGDFENIPGCESPTELGCVIGFSTFNAPVPADSVWGRAEPGSDILCTNPAALGGGSAALDSLYPSERFAPGTTIGLATEAVGVPRPAVSTPWYEFEGAYTGACDSSDDADVLEIAPVGGAPVLNPVPDATWGLHLVDGNIALGDLTALVKRQIKAYVKATG
jgi:hypothetical protein